MAITKKQLDEFLQQWPDAVIDKVVVHVPVGENGSKLEFVLGKQKKGGKQ